jgi:hypothetical protein
VSDYGLDDGAIEVLTPAEARDFSSNLCVQTGSGDHKASGIMGNGVPFPFPHSHPDSLTDITLYHNVYHVIGRQERA